MPWTKRRCCLTSALLSDLKSHSVHWLDGSATDTFCSLKIGENIFDYLKPELQSRDILAEAGAGLKIRLRLHFRWNIRNCEWLLSSFVPTSVVEPVQLRPAPAPGLATGSFSRPGSGKKNLLHKFKEKKSLLKNKRRYPVPRLIVHTFLKVYLPICSFNLCTR